MSRKIKFAEKDYISSLLPVNRKKQFSDLFKTEFLTLLKLALILLLSFLPYIFVSITTGLTLSSNAKDLISQGLTKLETNEALASSISIFALFRCLTLLVPFVVLAGIARVNRLMVYSEGVLFFKDFIRGIKDNFKTYFITGLIMILLIFATEVFGYYIGGSNIGNASFALNAIIIGLVFLIITPIFMINLVQGSIYSLPYFKGIVNAARVFVRSILLSFVFALLPFTIFLLSTFNALPIMWYGTIVMIVVLISPVYLLGVHMYFVSRFDVLINKKYYPQIYRKGLEIKE